MTLEIEYDLKEYYLIWVSEVEVNIVIYAKTARYHSAPNTIKSKFIKCIMQFELNWIKKVVVVHSSFCFRLVTNDINLIKRNNKNQISMCATLPVCGRWLHKICILQTTCITWNSIQQAGWSESFICSMHLCF